ncbi:hypothetical protein [Variovorax sp. UMC13]|uniref:hypothetical protein n=1 Tax=Variovorax sp. UMC13 TaxID=1862326 RepID=UPI0015FFE48D|nr:hypothetical protein [Variovorax sp. UMC13]
MDFSDSELFEMLAGVLAGGDLDGNSPAHDIASKVLAEGTEKFLTPVQAAIYAQQVRPHLIAAANAAKVNERRVPGAD